MVSYLGSDKLRRPPQLLGQVLQGLWHMDEARWTYAGEKGTLVGGFKP